MLEENEEISVLSKRETGRSRTDFRKEREAIHQKYVFGNDFLTRARTTFDEPYISSLIEVMGWIDKERGKKYRMLKAYSAISTAVFLITIIILTILLT